MSAHIFFHDTIVLRRKEPSGSNLAEHTDEKPPRGNVEALNAGTLREIGTA